MIFDGGGRSLQPLNPRRHRHATDCIRLRGTRPRVSITRVYRENVTRVILDGPNDTGRRRVFEREKIELLSRYFVIMENI